MDDGNTDNRANSAQFQLKLPTRAELDKKSSQRYLTKKIMKPISYQHISYNIIQHD